jgi:hypothetical protein
MSRQSGKNVPFGVPPVVFETGSFGDFVQQKRIAVTHGRVVRFPQMRCSMICDCFSGQWLS